MKDERLATQVEPSPFPSSSFRLHFGSMTPASKLIAQEARRRFAALVAQPEIDLARAALLIAAEEEAHARVDIERCLALLAAWGEQARADLARSGGSPVVAFNRFMFDELGFAGNARDYADPRNSFLNEVIARRKGIPITLAVVYMEVGRRAGLRMEGVGLPGHFIVRAWGREESEPLLVDPFFGRLIDAADCQERLDAVFGGSLKLTEEHLRAATTREILVRTLRNLKAIYAQAKLYRQAIATIERILLLAPEAHEELRDRSFLLAQTNRFAAALAAAQRYLRLAPDAPDAELVREQAKKIQLRLAGLN